MESPIPILPLSTPDLETEKLIKMKDEEVQHVSYTTGGIMAWNCLPKNEKKKPFSFNVKIFCTYLEDLTAHVNQEHFTVQADRSAWID